MTPEDALAVGLEHVRWLRAQGVTLAAAFAALDQTASPSDGWDSAVWLYAQAYYALTETS